MQTKGIDDPHPVLTTGQGDEDKRETLTKESALPQLPPIRPTGQPPKLGHWKIVLLTTSAAAICVAFGLISFLWFARESNNLWRHVVLRGWVIKTIALSTSAIDTAAVIQAAICTSMLAALLLESGYVTLPQLAGVSVLRSANGGPVSLISELRRGLRWESRSLVIAIALLALLVLTTLFRFASTILLLDVANVRIAGNPVAATVKYSTNVSDPAALVRDQRIAYVYQWNVRQPFYPVFAEFSEPPNQTDGVGDTGRCLRALLPLGTQSARESLRNYSGKATLVDARVTCIRPDAMLSVSMPLTTASRSNSSGDIYISGVVSASRPSPNVVNHTVDDTPTFASAGPYGVPVNCSVPFSIIAPDMPDYDTIIQREWLTSVCSLHYTAGGLRPDFTGLDSQDNTTFTLSPGQAFLVVNASGSFEEWARVAEHQLILSESNHGEWLALQSPLPNVGINISICYSSFRNIDGDINAYGSTPRTEPTLGWDATLHRYDTRDIRHQLGASRSHGSPEERGLLHLRHDTWTVVVSPNTTGAIKFPVQSPDVEWESSYGNHTVYMCVSCQAQPPPQGATTVHHTRIALFQDVLRDTQSPALAWQAHLTSLISAGYYETQLEWDVSGQISTTSFVTAQRPKYFRGYAIFATAIILYVSATTVTIAVFISKVRFSTLGNSWYTAAQVLTGEMTGLVPHGSMATDADVRVWLKSQGKERTCAAVETNGETVGFRGVVRVESRNESN